jgi:hypothetical protein
MKAAFFLIGLSDFAPITPFDLAVLDMAKGLTQYLRALVYGVSGRGA